MLIARLRWLRSSNAIFERRIRAGSTEHGCANLARRRAAAGKSAPLTDFNLVNRRPLPPSGTVTPIRSEQAPDAADSAMLRDRQRSADHAQRLSTVMSLVTAALADAGAAASDRTA